MPGLPLLDFTRLKPCKQFSRSQTFSIRCSLLLAGLSEMRFAVSVRTLRKKPLELHSAPPRQRPAEAGCSAACRSSSRPAYLPLPSVGAFVARATNMPAADFCRTVRVNRFTLSPDSGSCGRPPAIGLTAFNEQPPNLQPAPLMDADFDVIGQLLRRRMPHIRFLSIGSRLCSTLPSEPASRPRP